MIGQLLRKPSETFQKDVKKLSETNISKTLSSGNGITRSNVSEVI